jgi:hypothetical protein
MKKAISAIATLILLNSIAQPKAVQANPNGPECRFSSKAQKITDNQCEVIFEGSLDAKYGGQRTFIPQKATITWADGVKTDIIFKEILSRQGSAKTGTATVDGYTYQFTAFGTGGFAFERFDPQTSENKTISLSKWTGSYK